MSKLRDWKHWFAFRGRAGRGEYWTVFLTAMVAGLVCDFVAERAGFPALGLLPGLVLGVIQLAVTTRRLHDLGQSGWWQAPPLLLACLAAFLLGVMRGAAPMALLFAGLMLVLIWLLFLVLVGLMRGRPAPNRFET